MRIESLTNLGFGIARVDLGGSEGGGGDITTEEEGVTKEWVIFYPNVIPGELVKVRVYRNFASYSEADRLHIVEPSADRIEPACPLATVCGGYQYQHITIERQMDMKTTQVQVIRATWGHVVCRIPHCPRHDRFRRGIRVFSDCKP